MASLELYHGEEQIERVELNRREPVTIGQHSSNTLVIDSDLIPILFARILWNKKRKNFEISAAAVEDLEISGETMRSKLLADGDVIAVDPYHLKFVANGSGESHAAEAVDKLDDDAPIVYTPGEEPAESEATDDDQERSRLRDRRSRRDRKSSQNSKKQDDGIALAKPEEQIEEESVGEWLRKSRRPSERNPLRSPLVTTLLIIELLLGISVGGLYLLIGRQTAQLAFAAAKQDQDAGKFSQAITKYEQFLADFPSHKLSDEAQIQLGISRIERKLAGSGSNLEEAIAAIEQFVDDNRDRESFRDFYPLLTTYSSRIAITSYEQASRRKNPQFIETGDKARQLFGRFKATDGIDKPILD